MDDGSNKLKKKIPQYFTDLMCTEELGWFLRDTNGF